MLVHLGELSEVVKLLQRLRVVHARLQLRICSVDDMLLVAATRIRVIVDSRMAGQLVRSAETLGAAWELAGVRLLASVRPDVSRLVLETVECFVAERTLVWARQIWSVFVLVLHCDADRWHSHSGTSHGCGRLRLRRRSAVVVGGRGRCVGVAGGGGISCCRGGGGVVVREMVRARVLLRVQQL